MKHQKLPSNSPNNNNQCSSYSAISLFSGCGGMDVGFLKSGFDIKWANDINKNACLTYEENIGNHIVIGDINEQLNQLAKFRGVDCVFGGPPCQGFSVAGKMDLNDPRSHLVNVFMDVVEITIPKAFVMENVKSLSTLKKFEPVRVELLKKANSLGYNCEIIVLNSKDFGVPQSRERVFFVGIKNTDNLFLAARCEKYKIEGKSTLEAIKHLGPQESEKNPKTCNAKITNALKPILRKSPYAGMLFNGLGRPLNPNVPCATLPASMGGNKTPIIDERLYYGDGYNWVEWYHSHLNQGGKPLEMYDVPDSLRRLTINEACVLHSFPNDFKFLGGKSSIYCQIGNAVPCDLAHGISSAVIDILEDNPIPDVHNYQLDTLSAVNT